VLTIGDPQPLLLVPAAPVDVHREHPDAADNPRRRRPQLVRRGRNIIPGAVRLGVGDGDDRLLAARLEDFLR